MQGGPGTTEGDFTNENDGSDFVVLVLDVPESFETEYMGFLTYSQDWDGLDVWATVGYPGQFSPDADLPYVDIPFPVTNWTFPLLMVDMQFVSG